MTVMKRVGIGIFVVLFIPQVYATDQANLIQSGEIGKSLAQHGVNLSAMKDGLNDNDNLIKYALLSDEKEIASEFSELNDLSYLAMEMINSADKKAVRKLIEVIVNNFAGTCKRSIGDINGFLPLIQNRALMSEGEKLRDDVVKTCDRYKML